MTFRRASAAAAVVVSLAIAAPRAHADAPAWKDGRPRGFVAGELGAGFVLKAQVAAGWGRPHWWWFGAEALALSTVEFGAGYAGLRARLPFLDVTAGARWTRSYVHPRLPAASAHASLDGDGAGARAASLDGSATLYGPAPRGYAMAWVDVVHVTGVDADEHLFEELERAVVGGGTTVAARAAYLASLARGDLLVGPMLEHVWLGGRDGGAWRVGPAAFYDFSPRWQAALVLTTVVSGVDELGLIDGMWGTGLVRYRWASGR